MKRLITLIAAATLLAGSLHTKEYECCKNDYGCCYCSSRSAGCIAVGVIVGIVVIGGMFAIVVADARCHHDHSH